MNADKIKLLLSVPFICWLSGMSLFTYAQPAAVRNEVPRVGQQEVIMMRHAYLEKGSYDQWYQLSSQKVWPWFERLGARMIGDFQLVYPQGDSATPDQDEALRLARYASYEHWQATRGAAGSGDTGGAAVLAGNGGLSEASSDGIRERGELSQGSKGGLFLQGYMAQTRPLYMPGTGEVFAPVTDNSPSTSTTEVRPVRLAAAEPRDEILALEYRRIKKGSFEEFHVIARDSTWPYLEKIGARPVGQWQVAYLPNSTAQESTAYDEVYTLVWFASYDHYQQVTDNAISMGGDGPDYQLLESGLGDMNDFTQEVSVQFLKGSPFHSPPQYAPGLNESFKITE